MGARLGRRPGMAVFALLSVVVAGCTSDGADPLDGFGGPYCTAGPAAFVDESGVPVDVCFESGDDGVVLSAIGLLDGSTITVTGGSGDTVTFDWNEAEAGLFVNGIGQFVTEISGQIVSSPLRAVGTWSDGTPMEISVTWSVSE